MSLDNFGVTSEKDFINESFINDNESFLKLKKDDSDNENFGITVEKEKKEHIILSADDLGKIVNTFDLDMNNFHSELMKDKKIRIEITEKYSSEIIKEKMKIIVSEKIGQRVIGRFLKEEVNGDSEFIVFDMEFDAYPIEKDAA